jgi:hypothetical protein
LIKLQKMEINAIYIQTKTNGILVKLEKLTLLEKIEI